MQAIWFFLIRGIAAYVLLVRKRYTDAPHARADISRLMSSMLL